jgi:hypothetical protein
VEELSLRTRAKTRESGAFLLGTTRFAQHRIREFVYYDDIDPNALDTGIVHFAGARLGLLWEKCRSLGCDVVADVHVHPGVAVQSKSDQQNPVMPRAGHIGLILPRYAVDGCMPGDIGVFEYLGDSRWIDRSRMGRSFFNVA